MEKEKKVKYEKDNLTDLARYLETTTQGLNYTKHNQSKRYDLILKGWAVKCSEMEIPTIAPVKEHQHFENKVDIKHLNYSKFDSFVAKWDKKANKGYIAIDGKTGKSFEFDDIERFKKYNNKLLGA